MDKYLNLIHKGSRRESVFHKSKPEKLSEHLSSDEFGCRCNNCDANIISYDLIIAFESTRNEIGEPIRVNSGYRCTYHNMSVGGVSLSEHIKGTAIDMTYKDLDKLEEVARKHFNFVKRYESFVHADVRMV